MANDFKGALIGPQFLGELKQTIARVNGTPYGGGVARIETRFEEGAAYTPRPTRLGTISATWNKGSTATVTEQNGDGSAITSAPTFTATNHFATVTVSSGTKRVACTLIGSTWVLIAAEC